MLAGAVEFDCGMALGEGSPSDPEVRDGQIAKMNVAVEAFDVEMSGEVNAMGEGDSLDESMEVPPWAAGQLTIDEDGEVTRKDITEDASRSANPNWRPSTTSTTSNAGHGREGRRRQGVRGRSRLAEMLEAMAAWTPRSSRPAADAMEGIMETAIEAMDSPRPARSPRSRTASPPSSTSSTWHEPRRPDGDDHGRHAAGASDQMPPINAMLEMSMNMTGIDIYDIELGQYTSAGDGRRVRDRLLRRRRSRRRHR